MNDMGKKSRTKGYLGEYEWRKLVESAELPIIWHNEDPNRPDTTVAGLTCEVKRGSHIPKTIYDWLEYQEADILAVRRDRKEWLVVVRADLFLKMLKTWKKFENVD